MSLIIVLDASPLGLVSNPKISRASAQCRDWLQAHVAHGSSIIVPEIADYEVRRELIRTEKRQGLTRLDELISYLSYLPLDTASMRKAAELWAIARQQGQPTAGDNTIDCDMILVAQTIVRCGPSAVIATTNVGHLSRFVDARHWNEIELPK